LSIFIFSSGSTAHPKAIRLTNRYFLLSFSLYSSINKNFWDEDDVTLTWAAL
jgi:acyl-coenzyme A synthetase/AMP-(fatty) acid ligase